MNSPGLRREHCCCLCCSVHYPQLLSLPLSLSCFLSLSLSPFHVFSCFSSFKQCFPLFSFFCPLLLCASIFLLGFFYFSPFDFCPSCLLFSFFLVLPHLFSFVFPFYMSPFHHHTIFFPSFVILLHSSFLILSFIFPFLFPPYLSFISFSLSIFLPSIIHIYIFPVCLTFVPSFPSFLPSSAVI